MLTGLLKATNAVRDSIKPDVTVFVFCEAKEIEGKTMVAVKVERGTARPYYLAGKGIRPEDVYVKQGVSTVPATKNAILKMIQETAGDDYETTRSLKQELTFAGAEKALQEQPRQTTRISGACPGSSGGLRWMESGRRNCSVASTSLC